MEPELNLINHKIGILIGLNTMASWDMYIETNKHEVIIEDKE